MQVRRSAYFYKQPPEVNWRNTKVLDINYNNILKPVCKGVLKVNE